MADKYNQPLPEYGAAAANNYQLQPQPSYAPAATATPQDFGMSNSATATAMQNYTPDAFAVYKVPNLGGYTHLQHKSENNALDFSQYANSPLNMGLTAMPRQAHLQNLDYTLINNREIIQTPYSNNILENDCYQSPRFEPFARQVRWNEGENQGIVYATPQKHGTDQPTKYGISQDALDLYRRKFNDIANTYPVKVRDLTKEQAMNLLCQYYKGSRAEAINDPNLAFAHYDSYVNNPQNASIAWQRTLKNKVNSNIQVGGGIGSQTVNTFNSVPDGTELLNAFIDNRQQTIEDKYKTGLINRFRRYPIK